MFYRYSRWDGTQQVSPFSADDLMDALSEDLIADGDLRNALQRVFRWGAPDVNGQSLKGLQDLLEQLRERRQEELGRYNLGSMMDDLKKRLDDVVDTERQGIQRRLDQSRGDHSKPENTPSGEPAGEQSPVAAQPEQPTSPNPPGAAGQQSPLNSEQAENLRRMLESMAARKEKFLDELPEDFPGAVKSLTDYEFMDPEAREKFQELLKMLQQQILGNRFEGLKQQIEAMSPQDLDQMREMIRDLNKMLQEKAQGGTPNFQEFMDKHGQFFPPGIENLDQLVEHLQRKSAQMQTLMDSLPGDQRQQLQQMMDSLLRDDRMRWDMAQLAANLEKLMPSRQFRSRYPFHGDESLSMEEAMELMQKLQDIDQLEKQLKRAHGTRGLDDINADDMERLLGSEARDTLEQLRQLMQVLEDAGYVQKTEKGYEMTARGIRKIGQKALKDLFGRLQRDAFGKHETDFRGHGGERIDESKPYEFGDAFHLDLRQTMMNSLAREGTGSPLNLAADDFQVYRTELMTEVSTVLMVDMSRSMILRGCFQAAKKVALALDSLIRGQYPRDNLYVIVFSDYARELKPEGLPRISWDEEVYGTNMHHGFMLARQLLARHKTTNKQIIMITDGEPTAHLEGGRAYFSYPPTYRTMQETLKEVGRCTRDRIIINTFMLERGYYLVDFVNQMTKINKGRAFFASPDRLGEYVLVDYVASKKKIIR